MNERETTKTAFGFLDRSPIYWNAKGYDLVMRLLQGERRFKELGRVAELIEPGSSVVDLCCGTAKLYRDHLRHLSVDYMGLDANGHFIRFLKEIGINGRLFNVLEEVAVPAADYITMCSSFYHFRNEEAVVLSKMIAAARKAVVISEPVRNLSQLRFEPLGRFFNWLTRPGVGTSEFRYSIDIFREFANHHGAAEVVYEDGGFNAIAVFRIEKK